MSEIKALEELRESFDDCTQEAGIEPNTFDTVWITKSCAMSMLDAIQAEVDERFMELRDKSRKERVYWQNEIHAILDMLNGKERFWGACMEYPIDEYTVPPSEIARQELERKYMRLPVDADGVPIRVGDMIEYEGDEDTYRLHARGVYVYEDGHVAVVNERCGIWYQENCHHVKPRTLEDIVIEYRLKAYNLYADSEMSGEERVEEFRTLDAEVAAEIRELIGVDA